jgi:hypothetical protein
MVRRALVTGRPLAILALVAACGSQGNSQPRDTSANGEPQGAPQDSGVSPTESHADASEDPTSTPSEQETPNDPTPTDADPGLTSADPEAPPQLPGGEIVVEEDDVLIEEGEPISCEREIAFQAVVLSDPEPIDVVIVADHSMSLGWSKDDLSSGLSELLARISGRDARFFLLTPTQYGASSAPSSRLLPGSDIVQWKDPVTQEPYQNAVASYSEVCTDSDGQVIACPEDLITFEQPVTIEGSFDFVMPEPLANIGKDMTAEELSAQQEVIKAAILALGGEGASNEQPLCTLGRYVAQAAEQLPERVVFLVLSDEDDQSDPKECLTGLTYTRYRQPVEVSDCSGGCAYVRYWAFAPASRFWVSHTCVPTDDVGTPFPDQAVDGAFTYTTNAEDCSAGPDCTEANLNSVRNYCSPGAIISSCSRTCSTEPDDRVGCSIDLEDTTVDACTQPFEYGGSTYQNIAEFCELRHDEGNWGDCDRRAYSDAPGTGNWAGGLSPHRLAAGATTPAQLADHFLEQVDTVFGPDNYSVQLIAFRPEFACTPQAGQSYADNLASITSAENVFPICESYAPALERISGFAEGTLQAVYDFELSDRETLEAVVVTDLAGVERTLDPSQYQYDFTAFRLTLNRGAVTARDRELTVEVEIHCTPVVR